MESTIDDKNITGGSCCSGNCAAKMTEESNGEGVIKGKLIQYAIGAAFILASFFMRTEALKIAMYMAAYLIFGHEVLIALFKNLAKGQFFDENFLMGIATIGAVAIGEYPEAVGVMLFYNVGEFFQDMAVDKSKRSIKALIGIKPESANLETEGGIRVVNPSDVPIDSIIVVKPGERVPLDGVVVEGASQVDTSALTGESVPRAISVGSEALSGSINVAGLLKIRTTKLYADSTVQKIVETVERVSAKKAPAERFITKFSRYYTPIVVFAAAVISFIVPLAIGAPIRDWLPRGLVFLVVSCPCALVLSVPLGYFAGLGACSKKGILVKGGNYLQALTDVRTFVFDKTGTLTKGVFRVVEISPAEGFAEGDILELAANIEHFSNHPIAKSIVDCFGGSVNEKDTANFEEIAGFGVKADYKGETCYLGKAALIEGQGLDFAEFDGIGSAVYIAAGGKYAGYIVVADEIKEDSEAAVKALKNRGLRTVMLTGDKKSTAEDVGARLGIGQVFSELLPEEKLQKLEEIIRDNGRFKTAFCGDGINDAPALARADISIAMGGLGQDAAIEASDIVIMNDNPARIGEALRIASKTRRIVYQNIVFALSVKGIILLLGVLGFANMWLATFADVGVAFLCIINSVRTNGNGAKGEFSQVERT